MSKEEQFKERVELLRKIMDERINGIIDTEAKKYEEEFLQIPVGYENYKFELKFENRSDNLDPMYQSDGASGFDLRANLKEKVTLRANGGYQLIPTGLFFELPPNFEIQVRSRSGLAVKHGVAVLNSPGTVDSDYRGECSVILINHGNVPFEIKHGDRIAQAVIASVINKNIISLTRVDKIEDSTERSTSGFGSTGVS